jgi:hypothetical protein
MSYVPVQVWVPDTTSGPVTETVNLKDCPTCHALVPESYMGAHESVAHPPPPEVAPH